jgi:hypothetical protein
MGMVVGTAVGTSAACSTTGVGWLGAVLLHAASHPEAITNNQIKIRFVFIITLLYC